MRFLGWVCVFLFISSVFLATWSLRYFGFVPVGFGLLAPAGVYFAGLTFILRDVIQESLGKKVVIVAIITGSGLSSALSPELALASGVAFLLSEFLDFTVYTRLRVRSLVWGMVGSNAVGSVIDSGVFLLLAFGSLQFMLGQVVGKISLTLPAIFVVWGVRRFLGLQRSFT